VGRARVDYEQHGRTYARQRRADPRIAARITAALGDARTVLNVGAGTGSYEPPDRWVLAVEPSAVMRAQRPAGAAPVIAARAESLPFDDDAVDAAMACLTIHHWEPPAAGLAELRRVARGPVVVFTCELDCLPAWKRDYYRRGSRLRVRAFPRSTRLPPHSADARGREDRDAGRLRGPFFEAYWRRPEAVLDPAVRGAQSMWTLLPAGVERRIVARLSTALQSGAWDAEHGQLREQEAFAGALRLVISEAR
jgi:SAM-dependent methyltransferase